MEADININCIGHNLVFPHLYSILITMQVFNVFRESFWVSTVISMQLA